MLAVRAVAIVQDGDGDTAGVPRILPRVQQRQVVPGFDTRSQLFVDVGLGRTG